MIGKFLSTVLVGALAIFGLLVVLGSWYTVDEGDRGVILRWGSVVGIAQPGLGFKWPLIEDVVHISVQDHFQPYDLEAYSRDQQPADVQISVSYRLHPESVDEIYRVYGSREAAVERLVDRRTLEEFKTVFGRFNAETAIRERGRLNLEAQEAIDSAVTGPLEIISVQIEDIAFSSAYTESVEQRMLAEVAVLREQQNLAREQVLADTVRTQAAAQADRVRAEAQAEADAIRLRGDAEAQAIKARGDALRQNPSLISLVQAERWNGTLPTTMLPGGTVPFLNIETSPAPVQ